MWANWLEQCSAWSMFHLIVIAHVTMNVTHFWVWLCNWTEHSMMVHEHMLKHERAFTKENNNVKAVLYQNARAIENGWVSPSSRITWEHSLFLLCIHVCLFFTLYQYCRTSPEFRTATWSLELQSNCQPVYSYKIFRYNLFPQKYPDTMVNFNPQSCGNVGECVYIYIINILHVFLLAIN